MDKQVLNQIYVLINTGSLESARKKLNQLEESEEYEFEIDFLRKYLKEKYFLKKNRKNEIGNKIKEFLENGKNQMNFEDNETAINYFKAGAYFTSYSLFYYYIGELMFQDYETKEEGIEYLKKYIEMGAYKAYKAYGMLGNYYRGIDKEKASFYYDRFYRLNSVMFSNKKKHEERIKEETKIVQELSNNNDYNSLLDMFYCTFDEIKIKIIIEMYKMGYVNQADGLLKENRKKLQSNRNVLKLLNNFERNKKLYRNKGKYSSIDR